MHGMGWEGGWRFPCWLTLRDHSKRFAELRFLINFFPSGLGWQYDRHFFPIRLVSLQITNFRSIKLNTICGCEDVFCGSYNIEVIQQRCVSSDKWLLRLFNVRAQVYYCICFFGITVLHKICHLNSIVNRTSFQ